MVNTTIRKKANRIIFFHQSKFPQDFKCATLMPGFKKKQKRKNFQAKSG